jgi:hypothetical protein
MIPIHHEGPTTGPRQSHPTFDIRQDHSIFRVLTTNPTTSQEYQVMLKGNLKLAVPMPPPQGDNDSAAWYDFYSTPNGVEFVGTDFHPVPGQANVFTATAPEQYKLTVTATVLADGSIQLAYSRFVDESDNNLATG